MSLNIQTANGLQEIGKVTKEKIVTALGHEPADKKVVDNHIQDTTVHISEADRDRWDNQKYSDLEDAPNIIETETGDLAITDESGNIIMKVDEDGLSTTNISANKIKLAGEDLNTKLANLKLQNSSNIIENESNKLEFADEQGYVIAKIDNNGVETTKIKVKAITLDGEDLATKLDNLSIDSSPSNIFDDESGKAEFADEAGNVIARIDENGFETTTVTAKKIIVEDVNLKDKLETHIGDLTHLQEGEREKWNAKNDFNGDFNALTNSPLIQDDSGQIVFTDEAGNIIAQLNTEGFKTTTISSNTIKINDIDIKPYLLEIDYQNLAFDLTETILENQIIIPLTVLTFEESGNYAETNIFNENITETFNIWFDKIQNDIDQTYIVEWDGVPFTTTAVSLTLTEFSCIALGNLSLINQEGIEYPDTSEPFLLVGGVSLLDAGVKLIDFKTLDTTTTTHSIQITKVG